MGGAALSNDLTANQVTSVGMIGTGALYSAFSQFSAGSWNREMYNRMASDALARGTYAAGLARSKGTRVVAAGTAAYAGAGVDVSRGSPVDVAGGNRMMSELDAATIRRNAVAEAMGYQTRGDMAYREGEGRGLGTILTGMGRAYAAAEKTGLIYDEYVKPSEPYMEGYTNEEYMASFDAAMGPTYDGRPKQMDAYYDANFPRMVRG